MPITEANDSGEAHASGEDAQTCGGGLTGGCLCGAIRYRLASPPINAGWCHCRSCQLNSGTPAMAFATVPAADFIVEEGLDRIGRFPSSPGGERWFCNRCGTPLLMQEVFAPVRRDFSLATLDDPTIVAPAFHIFCDSRIAWDIVTDELPQYPRTRDVASPE